jgi:hypothetical protein
MNNDLKSIDLHTRNQICFPVQDPWVSTAADTALPPPHACSSLARRELSRFIRPCAQGMCVTGVESIRIHNVPVSIEIPIPRERGCLHSVLPSTFQYFRNSFDTSHFRSPRHYFTVIRNYSIARPCFSSPNHPLEPANNHLHQPYPIPCLSTATIRSILSIT